MSFTEPAAPSGLLELLAAQNPAPLPAPFAPRVSPLSQLPPIAPLGVGPLTGPRAPAVDQNYQRTLTTLTTKYAEMAAEIGQLPEPIRNALIQYDSSRVARGSPASRPSARSTRPSTTVRRHRPRTGTRST